MNDQQISTEQSIENRDEALQQVTRPNWMEAALQKFDSVSLPAVITGEQIRFLLIDNGLEKPHHHNAWGAFTRNLILKKRLTPTDKFVNMRAAKSHARMTRQYQVNKVEA